MRQKTLICAVMLYCLFGTALARSNDCSSNTAKTAEESIDQISTWPQAILYYEKYHNCLISGGVSYGYDSKLADLLAASDGVITMWDSTARQLWFRKVITQRVVGEAISLETSESILENLKHQCPPSGATFCKHLRYKIKKSCQACDSEK